MDVHLKKTFLYCFGQPAEAEFCPVDKKDLHIEFIGDSITSGEGLYGNPNDITAMYALYLKTIRTKNPAAKIIWAWGMISIDTVPALLQQGIEKYKADTHDDKVYSLVLEPMENLEHTDEDRGSRNHPGPATHKAAAQKITAFIKQIL